MQRVPMCRWSYGECRFLSWPDLTSEPLLLAKPYLGVHFGVTRKQGKADFTRKRTHAPTHAHTQSYEINATFQEPTSGVPPPTRLGECASPHPDLSSPLAPTEPELRAP